MTAEQRAVLAKIVEDPDRWYEHVRATFGPEMADRVLAEKCARWESTAAAMSKTRAEREAEDRAALVTQKVLTVQHLAGVLITRGILVKEDLAEFAIDA